MVSVDSQRKDSDGQEVAATVGTAHGGAQEVGLVLEARHDVPEHWVEDDSAERIVKARRQVDILQEVGREVCELFRGHLLLVSK